MLADVAGSGGKVGRLGLEPRTKALKGLRPLDKSLDLWISVEFLKAGKGVFWGWFGHKSC
jgi:hypothetical protein